MKQPLSAVPGIDKVQNQSSFFQDNETSQTIVNLNDNRSSAVAQRLEKENTLSSPRAVMQRQAFEESIGAGNLMTKQNNMGLPDTLKNGLEQLSGFDMSSVNVHYNSGKPSNVGALAYAQGSDIYLGPGQEKHLPHEGWHIVQQMQGRVKPTRSMNGISLNDDPKLETESDSMATKLNGIQAKPPANLKNQSQTSDAPVQRITPYFKMQKERWAELGTAEGKEKYAGRLITVGFEFDIGVMEKDNPLQGIAHLELLKGKFGDSPVPFVMETDAGNTLEVATAPYLLETQRNKPWPMEKAVHEAIAETQKVFTKPKSKGTIYAFANSASDGFGINWSAMPLNITPANRSTNADQAKANLAVSSHNTVFGNNAEVTLAEEKGETPGLSVVRDKVKTSDIFKISAMKDEKSMESPQINILTDAEHLETLDNPGASRLISGPQKKFESGYHKFIANAIKNISSAVIGICRTDMKVGERIANTIVQQAIVAPLQHELLQYQSQLAAIGKLSTPDDETDFSLAANLSSYIKDYSNIWLKTDLVTYLRGYLTADNAQILKRNLEVINPGVLGKVAIGPKELVKYLGVKENEKIIAERLFQKAVGSKGEGFIDAFRKVIDTLIEELTGIRLAARSRPALFEINDKLLGARHDTHLEQSKADATAKALGYKEGKLHLIEIRADQVETIRGGNARNKSNSIATLDDKKESDLRREELKSLNVELMDMTNEIVQMSEVLKHRWPQVDKEMIDIMRMLSVNAQVVRMRKLLKSLRQELKEKGISEDFSSKDAFLSSQNNLL